MSSVKFLAWYVVFGVTFLPFHFHLLFMNEMDFECFNSQFQPLQNRLQISWYFRLKIFPPILHKIQISFVVFMKEKMILTSV
jgi:hypothetical protein